MIFALDGNLPGNILAAKLLMARQPRRSIAIALLLVSWAINRQKLERVIGKLLPLLTTELLCTGLPGIAESHNVVDLHRSARATPSLEGDALACVWVVELATGYFAIATHHRLLEVAREDDIARITATRRCPARTKLAARIPSLGRTTFNGQCLQCCQCLAITLWQVT